MKAFGELTYLGQVRALRPLAEEAAVRFGLSEARLTLIQHGENATYRVETPEPVLDGATDTAYKQGRYLLRIHRAGYQTDDSIASELAWLAALRHDAELAVPAPVQSTAGEFLVRVSTPAIPEGRNCSLLRWLRGRFCRRRRDPSHFESLGRLMAHLHQHAMHWERPRTFTRRHWDWDGLFGNGAGYHLNSDEVWALVPPAQQGLFRETADEIRQAMLALGTNGDAYGLIHADLHMDNVLFFDGQARAIDFDDCGFGHWVYDFATALCDGESTDSWPRYRDALLEGYARIQPLPEALLSHLSLFMAGRQVSVMLWAIDTAQVNDRFRKGLSEWLQHSYARVRVCLNV